MAQELIENLAKNLGVGVSQLEAKMEEVLAENKSAWLNAGKDEETCTVLAARVAGRQLKVAVDKASKSGCVHYEGMFVRVPPYKDWGKMAYDKMSRELATNGLNDITLALIRTGKLVYFEAKGEGYVKHHNPSLREDSFSEGIEETTVSSLPKNHIELDTGDAFFLVWNNTTPKFPSGDKNFKYGAPRPQSEKERTTYFLGRKVGETGDVRLITVKANGDAANEQHPTFTPGRIALRPNNNNDTIAYAKPIISTFNGDESVASILGAPPFALTDDGADGIIPSMLGGLYPEGRMLASFSQLEDYYEAHRNDDDWWGQWVGVVGEVVHVDPRERGGFTVSVGDLDITSLAPTVEYVIPKAHENLLTFGLGSQVLLVGQTYKSRDDEMRFTTQGWWCVDAVAPANTDNAEGWDD